MEKEVLRQYANSLIDKMIQIKDNHKYLLSLQDVDAINDICNLVEHNIDRLEDM